MILSILICSLTKRYSSLKALIKTLGFHPRVEILVEMDDGQMSTGAKRNILLKRAVGEYVAFIDDDDSVVPSYISNILDAIRTGPDVVGFNGYISTDGGEYEEWKISKDLPYATSHGIGINGKPGIIYLRYNNHLSPIKREIALKIGYPDKYHGEDYDYARRLHESGLIKTEVCINKHLYYYQYKSKK